MTRGVRSLAAVVAAMACLLPCLTAAQARGWPGESPPRALPARDVKFPPYQTQILANGLRVVVVMHHEQPAVSVRLLIGAGSAQDPPGVPGVAALAAALLDQGTTTRNAGEIATLIDSIGGQLDTATGRDLTTAHVMVMKDSFDLGMRLLSDVARSPAFAEAEIERQRAQILSALRVNADDPGYIANVVFDRLVYGSHPYGSPSNGTAESVSRIRRDDLVEYHRKYFVPNNAILAVVGDISSQEAFDLAQVVFGDWAPADLPRTARPDPPAPARRVVIVDKPGAVQTEIRVGHLGIKRKEGDYLALDLALRVLGGGGANRLHRLLRTERGLTYGAEAQMETLKETGEFAVLTSTRPEATPEVLRLIVDEFFRLRRERVYERELADAKAYLSGHFPLTIETPDEIAAQVLTQLFYDLPLDDLQTVRRRVNAVEIEDVARVAAAYLRPDRLTAVLVGDASVFAGQLAGVGFGKYERIPMAELDLTRADLRRASQGSAGLKPPAPTGTPHAAAVAPRAAQEPTIDTALCKRPPA